MAEVYFLKNLPKDWKAKLPNCIFEEQNKDRSLGVVK